MANASVFSLFPLKAHYAQHKPSLADWKKAGYVDASGKVVPRSYVSFYVGDYDSAAWMYLFLPSIWSDKARGTIPLGWAFNPNLATRFAAGMDYFRRSATPNDLFVCGDSGAGYLNAGNLDGDRPYSHLPSGTATWQRWCSYWYGKFDLGISGFVIDGFSHPMSNATAAAYATFSPDGVVAEYGPKQPGLLNLTSVPTIYMEFGLASPADLPYALTSVKGLLATDSPDRPMFHDYRIIQWKPNEMVKLKEGIEQQNPNARVVDPYTFMGLQKLWLQQKGN